MAAAAVQNPPAQNESKAVKKKKTKVVRTESPAPTSSATPENAASVVDNDASHDDAGETPYVRELQK